MLDQSPFALVEGGAGGRASGEMIPRIGRQRAALGRRKESTRLGITGCSVAVAGFVLYVFVPRFNATDGEVTEWRATNRLCYQPRPADKDKGSERESPQCPRRPQREQGIGR